MIGIIYRTHKPGSSSDDKKYDFKLADGMAVKDVGILERIRKLAIPPAYTDVQINLASDAKIIYQGVDAKGRLQQKYSVVHTSRAKKEKFCRLISFGKAEPQLRADIKKYIQSNRVTQNKIIALILQIIWICGFRLGNIKYKLLYESFGVSNLLKRHLDFVDGVINVEFKGKKSVINKCSIKDRELVKEIKELVAMKKDGDEVFTYRKDGEMVSIKPTEINNFLKVYGEGTTSKDLRTFSANVLFIDYMTAHIDELMSLGSIAKRKKLAKLALVEVSSLINNTPGIAKSSYLLTEIHDLAVEDPRVFKKHFGGTTPSRNKFINYLQKVYCQMDKK